MDKNHGGPSDTQVEQIVGRLLQAGVLLAASVVSLGAVVYIWRHGWETADYSAFRGEAEQFRRVDLIVGGVRDGGGRALIQLGLLLLIATPVARVLFSAVAFVLQRDVTYFVITTVVLTLLLASLFGLV